MPGPILKGRSGTSTARVSFTGTSGTVVGAVANKRIRVFAYKLSNLLATTLEFNSNATPIGGPEFFPDKGGIVVPAIEMSWFETAPGEALNLTSSVSTQVGGSVIYDVVE